jgi:ferredoxin
MVQLTIDGRPVTMPGDATVLDAARELGIDIPALCAYPGLPPNTSCRCCLVRVAGENLPVPSCATRVREGMQIESETRGIHDLRRVAIELLLSDHAGDCQAPCAHTCPAHMDIPNMLRHVTAGDYMAAIAIIKQQIALPAILGRVCPEVCENACRRGQHDSPAAICQIKKYVADRDLAAEEPYQAVVALSTSRRVAVVGSGPTGLTAAYHLSLAGHAVTLFEAAADIGGRLRTQFAAQLPKKVLAAEAAVVTKGLAEVRTNVRIDTPAALDALASKFHAVLLCMGRGALGAAEELGLTKTKNGLWADPGTRMTSRDGVFAAGNAVRSYSLAVQSVAEGRLAAECIDAWLAQRPAPDHRRAYESRLHRLTTGEMCDFCRSAPVGSRQATVAPRDQFTSDERVAAEAHRCLECDCTAVASCALHRYAQQYDCDARRFGTTGQHFRGRIVAERVQLEIGKCIVCGICVQLAARTPGALGLAVMDRSTGLRVAPPAGISLDAAMGTAAQECARACPTGAIQLR